MRDYWIVFKILLKNQYSRRVANNGSRKLSSSITMLLCIIPLVLLFCLIGGFVATIIPDAQTLSTAFNVIVTLTQLMAIFLTMFNVMNSLYNAPDTPFLNTLPVRHTAVFFAKFSVIYLSTLSLMSAILIPTMLTISIVYAALGRAMFYGFFALILLIALVAPILPLFIVTLFSMPMSYIGTFFKGKSVLKTVLSLLFYVLIMIGYMLLIYFLGRAEEGDAPLPEISAGTLAGLGTFAKVMYPNKVLLDFCLGIEAGKNFGISAAINVGIIVVMLLLAMLFYKRINERRLETHTEASHKNVSFKQTNIVASLMKKDFKHIMRNSNLAMSCLANIIICPVITAVMYFASDFQASGDDVPAFLNSMLKLSYIVLYTLIFLGGTNMMAMLAYTREGKSFYLSKSLPISPRDSIKSKFILALIPSGIVLFIQIILAIALYKLDVLSVVLFLVCASLAIVGTTALHIYCDMRYGNVNWNTRQDMKQVSQSNKGSLLVAFAVIAIGLIAMIGGMVLSSFADIMGGVAVAVAVFWTVLFVLCAILCVAGVLTLKNNAERYYDQIGERQFKPKTNTRASRARGGNMLMK